MTSVRRKRLEHLEAIARLRRPERPWVDDAPFVVPIIMAMFEGRPFEWLPAPEREFSENEQTAFDRAMRDGDRTAASLEVGDPGCAARFQADVERKRAANLRAIEREQATREAA